YNRNTQLDLLAEGVLQLASQQCVNDLFTGGAFRPERGYVTGYGDESTAGLPGQIGGQAWLASRLPDALGQPTGARPSAGLPYWRYISRPPVGDRFDSPLWPQRVPVSYARRQWALPCAISVPGGGEFPALRFIDPENGSLTPPVLAGDADGDGIADAGLVKLPVGRLNGITYYYAVRIIDNNSAVNATVAWEPNPLTTTAQGLPGDFFPTNIDLRDLTSPFEIAALNTCRAGGTSPDSVAWEDPTVPGASAGRPRPDFRFGSPYEALWMQLGRRT